MNEAAPICCGQGPNHWWKMILRILLGGIVGFVLGFVSVWYQDYGVVLTEPLPNQSPLAQWGSAPHVYTPGTATRDMIQLAFGEPAEQRDGGRTCIWRSTYCHAYYRYRRWLYREKFMDGTETFIPYVVVATFDENDVLTSWYRALPTTTALPEASDLRDE